MPSPLDAARTSPPTTAPHRRPPSRRWGAAGLLKATHPLPATAVTLFAAVLAVAAGQGPAAGTLTVLAVAAGQLSVGWCNDHADLGRDLTTGRRDKPLVTGQARPRTVAVAARAALALCVPLSLACGLLAGCVHLLGVAAAWCYNLRLKSTAASPLPYALAFGLLPAFVTLGLPAPVWPPLWLTAAAALLGTGAHFANVLPDLADDVATAVNGLPQRLGPLPSAALAVALVLASTVVLVLGPAGPVAAHGWWLLGAATLLSAVALLRLRALSVSRLPFITTMLITAADLGHLLILGTLS